MPKAYFIDVQGTLIDDRDKKPIEGAIEFIEYLNNKKIPYLLITNNTKKPSQKFFEFLTSLGFPIAYHSYIDTFTVLQEIAPYKRVAVFGTPNFVDNITALEYEIVEQNPEAIIITLNQYYTNDDYAKMIGYALEGAKVIGMHGTSIYAKGDKSYPGVGAMLAMIHYATKAPTQVVGKPSKNFYQKGLKMLQTIESSIRFEDIEIISDDVIGDLVGAKALGMHTSFVLSGKYPNSEIIKKLEENEKPDRIYKNMAEILATLDA
jgi:NagD protein